MPKAIKAALSSLTKLNIKKHNILELEEEQVSEDVFNNAQPSQT